MDLITQLAREALLHFKGQDLVAVTYKGELFKVIPMNQGDREDFYSVDIAKV